FSSAWFLASRADQSSTAAQLSTLAPPSSNSGPVAAPLVTSGSNHAPSGTDKALSFSEDNSYTFGLGDFGFSDPADAVPPSTGNHTADQVLVLFNAASPVGT